MRVNPALILGTVLFGASPVYANVEVAKATPQAASARESGVHSRAAQPRLRVISQEQTAVNPKLYANVGSQRAVNSDAQRYAQREAHAGAVQDYRGGDTVVIGATTATIVLAVILLIVLL